MGNRAVPVWTAWEDKMPKSSLCYVKMKPELCWLLQMLMILESWNYQGELQIGSGNSPRKRCLLQVERQEWQSHITFVWSKMRLHDFTSALIGFSLSLVHYFLPIHPLLPFGMVMCILCHLMLEVCDPLFFILPEDTDKTFTWVSKQTLDF